MTIASHPLRVAFAGTPDFAVPALEALLDAGHEVAAIYSQPDRPAGRGRKLRPSPVKACALAHDLEIRQPLTLRDPEAQQALAALKLDAMIVVAYGLILPPPVLTAPRLGCINVHASLLPRWRGAAPIQRALLAGDAETGVTIMQMEQGLDTGPMLVKESLAISPTDTSATLHDRLAVLGAQLLTTTLPALDRGELVAETQDPALATYANKLAKTEARLDWSAPAVLLDRQVRGLDPWPVAEARFGDQPLRIWQATPLQGHAEPPGRIVHTGPEGIDVACGDGLLRLLRLQLPGKRPVTAGEFANGRAVLGLTLG